MAEIGEGALGRGDSLAEGVIGVGRVGSPLSASEVREVLQRALYRHDLAGKRVLVIIPDGTRTAPIPLLFRLFGELLGRRAAALDYLVALGTHRPMDDAALSKLVGAPVRQGRAGDSRVFNHEWQDAQAFVRLGTIPAAEVSALSQGMLSLDVHVDVNRLILDYDQVLICGPVFPHEVVGFSGGHKYLFPGISGPEMINVTHWLGALLTSMDIIGTRDTPVRRMIDRAASLVPVPMQCVALVVEGEGLAGMYAGPPKEAWQEATRLSEKVDIVYVDRPFERVLSVMPAMYDDLWTAAKGMYKLEPVIADGGEVVIYAPHISEVSYTHGRVIDEVGYHVRDYFVKQWGRFKGYPWGVLAHSTHLRGRGTYVDGVERARIKVTLATGIPRERCRRIGLGYLDPDSVEQRDWEGHEEGGVKIVHRAGEVLYRLRQ